MPLLVTDQCGRPLDLATRTYRPRAISLIPLLVLAEAAPLPSKPAGDRLDEALVLLPCVYVPK